MTTSQIETQADRGGLASGDINLKVILRRKVVPQFLRDLRRHQGYPGFLRVTNWSQAVAALDREYDLPSDFEWMEKVKLYSSATSSSPLEFIGEDADFILDAEANTTPAAPSGFWFVKGTGSPYAIRLNTIPAAAATLRGIYLKTIVFANDEDAVEMDTHIPHQMQWGLVELLRAELMGDRYGLGDSRYSVQMQRYADWMLTLDMGKEQAARRRVVSVR